VDDVTSKLENHEYNMKLNINCVKMHNKKPNIWTFDFLGFKMLCFCDFPALRVGRRKMSVSPIISDYQINYRCLIGWFQKVTLAHLYVERLQ